MEHSWLYFSSDRSLKSVENTNLIDKLFVHVQTEAKVYRRIRVSGPNPDFDYLVVGTENNFVCVGQQGIYSTLVAWVSNKVRRCMQHHYNVTLTSYWSTMLGFSNAD